MKIYTYNTDIGTFEIRQTGHKRYELWFEDELLGAYENPELAAKDVANFDTGYVEWDKFENGVENCPHSLEEWTEVREEHPE